MPQDVRFDGEALIAALDEQRRAHGLDWNGLAAELWAQSRDLNAELRDNAMSGSAGPDGPPGHDVLPVRTDPPALA